MPPVRARHDITLSVNPSHPTCRPLVLLLGALFLIIGGPAAAGVVERVEARLRVGDVETALDDIRAHVARHPDDLPAAELFVDLGGGPAHYACEAVRRHDGLRALLVDLPLTVEVAQGYIADQGEQERV